MTDRELMQMALDTLDLVTDLTSYDDEVYEAIDALHARLAQPEPEPYPDDFIDALRYHTAISEQPEQEPVACDCDSPAWCKRYKKCNRAMLKLEPYVAPQQREWQGLTENEIKHLWYEACQTNLELTSQLIVHLARNIEAKLKEKNT